MEGRQPREAGGSGMTAADAEMDWDFSTPRDSSWFEGRLYYADGRTPVSSDEDVMLHGGACRGAAAISLSGAGLPPAAHRSVSVPLGCSRYINHFHPRPEGDVATASGSRQAGAGSQAWPGRGVPLEAEDSDASSSLGKLWSIVKSSSHSRMYSGEDRERCKQCPSRRGGEIPVPATSSLASLQRRMPVPASCFTHALCSRVPLYKRIQNALCSGASALTSEEDGVQKTTDLVLNQPRSIHRQNLPGVSSDSQDHQDVGSQQWDLHFLEKPDMAPGGCEGNPAGVSESHRCPRSSQSGDEGAGDATLELTAREPPDGTATPSSPVGGFPHSLAHTPPLDPPPPRKQDDVADPYKEFLALKAPYHLQYRCEAPSIEHPIKYSDLQNLISESLFPTIAATQLAVSTPDVSACQVGWKCPSPFLPLSPPPSPPSPPHANPVHMQQTECVSCTASPLPRPASRNGPQQTLAAAGRSSPRIPRDALDGYYDDASDFGSVSLPSTPEASISPHPLPDGAGSQEKISHEAIELCGTPLVNEEGGDKWCPSSCLDPHHGEASCISPSPTLPCSPRPAHTSPLTTASPVCDSSRDDTPSPNALPAPSPPPESAPAGGSSGPHSSHKSIIPEAPSQQSSIFLAVDPPVPQSPEAYSLVDLMKLGSYDGYVTLPVTFKSAHAEKDEVNEDRCPVQSLQESEGKTCTAAAGAEGDVSISTQVRVSLRKFCRRRRNGSKKLIIRFTLCLGKCWGGASYTLAFSVWEACRGDFSLVFSTDTLININPLSPLSLALYPFCTPRPLIFKLTGKEKR